MADRGAGSIPSLPSAIDFASLVLCPTIPSTQEDIVTTEQTKTPDTGNLSIILLLASVGLTSLAGLMEKFLPQESVSAVIIPILVLAVGCLLAFLYMEMSSIYRRAKTVGMKKLVKDEWRGFAICLAIIAMGAGIGFAILGWLVS